MSRDRFPRVPVQATEAQLPGIAVLLGALDAGACVEVTDGVTPGLRRWTGSAFVALSAYTVEADNAHPTSAALPSTYPLGASTCSQIDTTGWTAARPPGQSGLTTPMRIETFRSASNGALQRVTYRDVLGLPVTWERTATADAWNAAAIVNAPVGLAQRFYAASDFMSTANDNNWAQSISGTGANVSAIANSTLNRLGLVRLSSGTTATGRVHLGTPATPLRLGIGQARMDWDMSIPTLSTAAETFTVRAGFLSSTSAESPDGVFFRYTHSVNGGAWQAVCRNNNTEAPVNLAVAPAAGSWANYEISVNAAGTSAEFKINGAVVATITTNIPTAGRNVGYGVFGLKSAGLTSVPMIDIDWAEVELLLTTSR